MALSSPSLVTRFQSTPPVKAATCGQTHSLRPLLFQSTPPVKAATVGKMDGARWAGFQSTPPVKAATFLYSVMILLQQRISIHAAREGGDCQRQAFKPSFADFNPRRP